jgi:acyl-CoA oxidase
VFRAVQDHAVDAARAHLDRVILEAFADAVKTCPDPELTDVLDLVCDLYALHNVEADKGFFQEHGRLAAPRCKAITREVNRLCNEVRGHAALLTDAFGIPDQVLGAPIGVRSPDAVARR